MLTSAETGQPEFFRAALCSTTAASTAKPQRRVWIRPNDRRENRVRNMDSTATYRSKHLHSPSYYDLRDSPTYSSPRYMDRKKSWYSFQRGPKSPSSDDFFSALQHEADYLRAHTREQDLEINHLKKKLQVRDQQQADLQAKWNFHSFKYQLLVDMWAMRVLDNETEGDAEYQ